MSDPGYRDYTDGRLQPDEPDEPSVCCGTCAFYRDVIFTRASDGAQHMMGVCVVDVYDAQTLREMFRADVITVDSDGEPCTEWRCDDDC